jgi:hypothetical protein
MPRLRSSRNRVRPRFHCFHTTERSRRRSHISTLQHRRRLAVAEASEPASQIRHKLLDHLPQTNASGPVVLLSKPLPETIDGLGGDPPPWFSFAGEAECEKLPLPWSGHGAFRPIDLELETVSPLPFAMTSPPSGCQSDFHPQAVERARHTKKAHAADRVR